ncbi:hypothetical protein DMB66_59455 [Actinoplanes sp. ATCC 53533]|uniref:hypothetical protein n=1 Tax=Actinoplanes sp. ATCC 53533 TaxID=1288362 RepID=UPI000F791D31|nr:hypothetical protein [Actinoplanes sp. ATCC 53533]RSM37674.1 hypothetical protein DMB66_59455 [Actinoplanes sp. ATCC 53533]
MNWFLRNLGIFIATIAVGLSFATVVLGRRQRRQDMYLRVHETLIDVQMQRGRRLLHRCAVDGALPPEESDEFAIVSRTLSVHNAVAIYVRRGIVPQRWVLAEWRNTLCDMRRGFTLFRAYREETYGWQVLVELDTLISSAEKATLKSGGAGVGPGGHKYQPRYLGAAAPIAGNPTTAHRLSERAD